MSHLQLAFANGNHWQMFMVLDIAHIMELLFHLPKKYVRVYFKFDIRIPDTWTNI